ncbi:hypothetical protein [Streptomyces sp. H27-C3]|uniref:hypothetical protein n=1 Tax=Streptomyces sp. H27-C3 TaxID=3046305 RepID=UPI0024BB48B3|nr:hypothetical protein [Streptomyces sp. H27-C3]MDJ0464857.1 hypothetical protein [Streptomyces sp. H27-C3]
MSATQKKVYAVAFCITLSLFLGLASGVVTAALGASVLASVSAGGAAFLVICGIGVAIIGLFDFPDDRRESQQGAPQL